jgi:hypothetical protein
MATPYPVLRYPGNVSGADALQEGCLLGWDVVGRPYEVIDTEWIPEGEPNPDCGTCHGSGIDPADALEEPDDEGPCPRCVGHTDVFLQYATPEHIREQAAELQATGMRLQKFELEIQLRAARPAAAGRQK